MSELTLIVLAAGVGSRFGGVKQMATVDDTGHTLIDYSIFDACRAGFGRIICVVTPQLEPDFHERVGRRIARHADLVYAHQTLDALPPGYDVPDGRVKPWGTAQAVLVAIPQVDGPFATINADDFYGQSSYEKMATFLGTTSSDHAMIGYRLTNTLSPSGTVSRGVCQVGDDGYLVDIHERTALKATEGGATDADGTFYPADTLVSMNFWGFRADAAQAFRDGFPAFLDGASSATSEYYLPDVARQLIPRVRVIPTSEAWLGVTYSDDLPAVRQRLAELVEAGVYPPELWP